MTETDNLYYYPPEGIKMTKKWRKNQIWYKNGKSCECEHYQRDNIEHITNISCDKTTRRINTADLRFIDLTKFCDRPDGYEWTEDFDGLQIFGDIHLWYNLKMVCESGGAQTRSLREVFIFIRTQLNLLLKLKNKNNYFINILDGDTSYKNMDKFKYLTDKKEYKSIIERVYIGDLFGFKKWFYELKSNNIDIMEKHQKGQFYTTNVKKIFDGIDMKYFKKKQVIEPFVGNGDLVKWLLEQGIQEKKITVFDIDPKEGVKEYLPDIDLNKIKQDTLIDPPDYKNKIVVTNPPYLARNKFQKNCDNQNCEIFEENTESDLYRIFIRQLIDGDAYGGILIVPLNFLSSQKKADMQLRIKFLKKYKISKLNIFEEQVFEDTTNTVIAFKFIKQKTDEVNQQEIEAKFYPSRQILKLILNDDNYWLHGGELLKIIKEPLKKFSVKRLETKHEKEIKNREIMLGTKKNQKYILTNIKVNLLDSGLQTGRIKFEYDETPFYGIISERNKMTALIHVKDEERREEIEKKIKEIDFQKKIINESNDLLNKYREKYRSMFLANFREAKAGDGRKRCSYALAYGLIAHSLNKNLY